MNWNDLKIKIEAAPPGFEIEIPKGMGAPPPEILPIKVPPGITIILNEPLPAEVEIFPDKSVKYKDWWGE